MAGLDEAQARDALTTMHARLGRGPHVVLGVPLHPDPDEIRAAFLALTKTYHPVRFGRMSAEIQRFANEVFLGIMGAHDALRAPVIARTATSPGAPGSTTQPSPPGSQRHPSMGMPPVQRAPSALHRQGTDLPPITSTPQPRPGTDPLPPIAPTPQPRPGTDRFPAVAPTTQTGPLPVRHPAPATTFPAVAPTTQTGPLPVRHPAPATTGLGPRNPARPAPSTPTPTGPVIRTPTPTRPAASIARTERTMPMPPAGVNAPSAQPPRPTSPTTPLDLQRIRKPDPAGKTPPSELTRPPTARPVVRTASSEVFPRVDTTPGVTSSTPGSIPITARLDPSTTRPPAPSVAVAVELLAQQRWDAARVALSALTAMAPDSKHVRALICFAAGRQAQLEQRIDEARVDLQRALQLDPDLAVAKAALSELFTRRK